MNFIGMRFREIVKSACFGLVVVLSVVGQGCATDPSPKFANDIDSLKRQVWSLEKQTAEVNLRLAQNNNEVALLGEKLKRVEEAVNSLRDAILNSGGQKNAALENSADKMKYIPHGGLAKVNGQPGAGKEN